MSNELKVSSFSVLDELQDILLEKHKVEEMTYFILMRH